MTLPVLVPSTSRYQSPHFDHISLTQYEMSTGQRSPVGVGMTVPGGEVWASDIFASKMYLER